MLRLSQKWVKPVLEDRDLMRIPYLMKRGDSLRYRRIVPEDVREALGGKVVWSKTWKPSIARQAVVAEADRLSQEHDDLIARARLGEVLDPVIVESANAKASVVLAKATEVTRTQALARVIASGLLPEGHPHTTAFWNAYEHGGRYVPETLTLKRALEKDQERAGKGRDEKPFDYGVDSFTRVVGVKDVREITRDDAFAWIEAQREAGLAESTIARRANSLHALLTRTYLHLEVAKPNPFSKLGLQGRGDESDRLPFTAAHLVLIDTYVRESKATADTKNILRLLKFTGAGPAEVGGLVLADVKLDHEVPHIRIRRNELRGMKAKKGKHNIRERNIPLIGEALDAARDAVERVKGNPRGQLFKAFCEKRGADKISATLNKAIRTAGVPVSPRLTSYSFRHGIIQAMKAANVSGDLRRLIAGHHAKDAHDNYGSPSALLSAMRDAMLSAVPHLGKVEESDYTAAELREVQ